MSVISDILSLIHGRPFKMYRVATFNETYRYGLLDKKVGEDVFLRLMDAKYEGRLYFKVYDDEMEAILSEQKRIEDFNRKLGAAVDNNNDGIALEKAGDIAGAIEKFEQNILPDTYFTLHPYHRLCVLYRRAGDYDNEIRVIETCLARPEWKGQQYNESKELAFFEDRLVKAKKYREQHQQK